MDSGDIRPGAVKRGDLAANAVNSVKTLDNSLTGDDINEDSLSVPASGPAGGDLAGQYPNPTVQESQLNAGGALTGTLANAGIANGAIGSANLADGAVTSTKLGRVVVRTALQSVADNSANSANATCNAGETAVGGGGSLDAFVSDVALISSRPADSTAFFETPANGNEYDAWRASAVNPAGGTGAVNVRAHVLCLQP